MYNRRFTVIFILSLLLIVSSLMVEARTKKQDSVIVQARVEVMQDLEIVKPTRLTLTPGESRVIEQAGEISLESNADWVLELGLNREVAGKVYVRSPGADSSSWQHVNPSAGGRAVFAGKRGDHELIFDVRLVPSGPESTEKDKVSFNYTLSPR